MKLLSKLPVTNCNHNIKSINHVLEKHDSHDLVWFRIRLTPTLFCSDSPGMGLLVAIAWKWKVRRSDVDPEESLLEKVVDASRWIKDQDKFRYEI